MARSEDYALKNNSSTNRILNTEEKVNNNLKNSSDTNKYSKNSTTIERHYNRYLYDRNTVYFDNLIGGFIDGNDFIPIRFGLKHSRNGKATLYVIVDQNTIELNNFEDIKKTKVIASKGLDKSNAPDARLVNIKLSQIFKFVNNKDILRYIPDDFLVKEQKVAIKTT
ncbi:MAG: hypothetical protein IKA85_05225 [Clostridia bacterium]|nr:hypothetical protein [Clostridia bacterium]